MPGQSKDLGKYDLVYDPRLIGGEGSEQHASGTDGGGSGGEQGRTQPGMGSAGGSVPYQQVLGEYRQAAGIAMARDEVAPGMRALVEQYFSKLAE